MTTMIFHLSCFVSLPLMTFALLNDVCETYLPESFQGTLSDGLVPFTVVPATLNYYPGKAVTVEIRRKVKNDARILSGLVVYARNIVTKELVGDFFSFNSIDFKGYNCGKASRLIPDHDGSTTIVSRELKPISLPYTVQWMSHYNNGTVEFVGTMILSNSIYWTQALSPHTLSAGDTSELYDCSHKYDCGDMICRDTREQCPERCPGGQFRCVSTSRCIDQSSVCNDVSDCGLLSSREDEYSNICQDCREHKCMRSNICLLKSDVCDNTRHCPHGDDESFEGPNKCCNSGFLCDGGIRCLESGWVCDKVFDCDDRSDEDNCEYVSGSCTSHQKKCSDGKCVGRYNLCDGEVCDLGTHISCDAGTTCVPNTKLCDGLSHCSDGSDEESEVCRSVCSKPTDYLCPDLSKCLHIKQRCDERFDCDDRADEDYNSCYYFNRDCTDFSCRGSKQCIPHNLVCDQVSDCIDSSDETNCVCDFYCDGESLCFSEYRLCDGTQDCSDGTDEQNCGPDGGKTTIIVIVVVLVVLVIIIMAILRVRKRTQKRRHNLTDRSNNTPIQTDTMAAVPPSGTATFPAINVTSNPSYESQHTARGTQTQQGSPYIQRTHGSPGHSRPSSHHTDTEPIAPPSYSEVFLMEHLPAADSEAPPPSYESLPAYMKEEETGQDSGQGLLSDDQELSQQRNNSPTQSRFTDNL